MGFTGEFKVENDMELDRRLAKEELDRRMRRGPIIGERDGGFGEALKRVLNQLQSLVYKNAVDHGFHDKPVQDGTRIALMHSELSEALEALRAGNPPSEKIPEFSGVEEELADVIIRAFDFAGANGLNLAGAIIAKHNYNTTRPHMHGGKAF